MTQTAGPITSFQVITRIRERKLTLRTDVPKLSLS